ncbi:MAG: RNA methyltransferase [bacterium]|jgi:hypothetical protein|nr:RNA methyltransferase [bacterium]
MSAPLYVALLHYPVYKKSGEVITTSITPLDMHDIARSCLTYGVEQYFVVHHMPTMKFLAHRIQGFWRSDYGAAYNHTRNDAFSILQIVDHLENAFEWIETRHGKKPKLVATSAKAFGDRIISFQALSEQLRTDPDPYLLLFGTGWGLIREFLRQCDLILEPINGPNADYNHLSVRSAAAIALDRLCGR